MDRLFCRLCGWQTNGIKAVGRQEFTFSVAHGKDRLERDVFMQSGPVLFVTERDVECRMERRRKACVRNSKERQEIKRQKHLMLLEQR
jgi:hypothetical protein